MSELGNRCPRCGRTSSWAACTVRRPDDPAGMMRVVFRCRVCLAVHGGTTDNPAEAAVVATDAPEPAG